MPAADPLVAPLAQWLEQMPIVRHLGITLVSAEPGSAELQMPYRDEISYGKAGGFPASAVGALVDFCGGLSAASIDPAVALVTVDFTVKMVSRAYGARLVARGRLARSTSSLRTCSVEVFTDTEAEAPCALGLVTMRAPAVPSY